MQINLECEKCGWIFDSELGKLEMDKIGTLIYEKKPVCPKCKAYDKVLITQNGFNQINEWFLNYLTNRKQGLNL
jgi:rubredoxin